MNMWALINTSINFLLNSIVQFGHENYDITKMQYNLSIGDRHNNICPQDFSIIISSDELMNTMRCLIERFKIFVTA